MSTRVWRWVTPGVIFAIHDRQISQHGGAQSIRDLGAIESALARPRNLASYGDPDAAELAATYAHGIVRNHGFVDGNKRTAWIAARLFLADNGYTLTFDPHEAIAMMEALAAGRMSMEEAAGWFRQRVTAD